MGRNKLTLSSWPVTFCVRMFSACSAPWTAYLSQIWTLYGLSFRSYDPFIVWALSIMRLCDLDLWPFSFTVLYCLPDMPNKDDIKWHYRCCNMHKEHFNEIWTFCKILSYQPKWHSRMKSAVLTSRLWHLTASVRNNSWHGLLEVSCSIQTDRHTECNA